jgi:hypothetical protein
MFLRRKRTGRDVEMQSRDSPGTYPQDRRDEDSHEHDDPHFIADYLAQNTSKAAAVFRRYDKLVMYRLLLLSRELNNLEEAHDEFVEGSNNESVERADDRFLDSRGRWFAERLEKKDFDARLSTTVKEYCMKLRRARTNEGTR